MSLLSFLVSVLAADVILVGAEVALNTILIVANALLDVLAANVVRCVLVAAVIGVAAVIVVHMAGHAALLWSRSSWKYLSWSKVAGFHLSRL